MENVLLVIHMMLAIAMVILVLLQRSSQDGGGLMGGGGGGGTMGGLFTARGSANIMTRATAVLATLFICTSLILGIMAGSGSRERKAVDKASVTIEQQAPAPAAAPTPPTAPQVPLAR